MITGDKGMYCILVPNLELLLSLGNKQRYQHHLVVDFSQCNAGLIPAVTPLILIHLIGVWVDSN